MLREADASTKAINKLKEMNASYAADVRAMQRAAGIRITEEMAGYDAGVEMGINEREMYGYDRILNAASSIKAAEETLNALVADQKFNDKFKDKFQALSAKLNAMHGTLNNLASPNKKPGKKLEP